MYVPHERELLPHLSLLLDQALQSGNPRAAAPLHALLLKAGLLARFHARLFLCYAVASADGTCSPCTASSAALPQMPLPVLSVECRRLLFGATRAPISRRAGFLCMHGLGLPLCSYALCSAIAAAVAAAEEAAALGMQAHAYTVKSGWASAVFVGGALVNLYVKLGGMGDARKMFDEIPLKNATCANTLLMGYVNVKLWPESLALVREMLAAGPPPDDFTLSAALRIRSRASAPPGEPIEEDALLLSLLVEMYGNCGRVEEARRAGTGREDVVLWTSMLNAHSRNGQFPDVARTFDEMLAEGTPPDGVAFVAVLSACSRTADLAGGLAYFQSMTEDHRISPWPEHYGCVVHLLCMAGETKKAWELAEGGGTAGGVRVWGALLAACSELGDVEMGKRAARRALEEDPGNVGVYVELCNLYARKGCGGRSSS
ncbi:unnamed protein product [Spirodela intermedia]|uniref:Uncharacterized protein n=1 Tax=Spirodela intermedia TaxID=51605 RepID=A0A7I8JVC1_SPIIN|nr:unnamed protein product [Spirodela intermedia]CAA6673715.1 unnamed protein product [Spirodela intermedia]